MTVKELKEGEIRANVKIRKGVSKRRVVETRHGGGGTSGINKKES